MDSLSEMLDRDETSQTPIQAAANLNDSLVTPNKQPCEPQLTPTTTNDKNKVEQQSVLETSKLSPYTMQIIQPTQMQPYQIQANSMPSIEQSPLPQNTLNLSSDALAPFFQPQTIANCFYTPNKPVTTNFTYPLTYTTSVEYGYSNAMMPQCAVAYVPTDMTITAAMPTTIMSAQMQSSAALSQDEMATLTCQLEHGLPPRRIGCRDKRYRFQRAKFTELESLGDDVPPAQVI